MKKSEQTRLSILEAAFRLIYMNGYQATSIDDIIKEVGVTKGAFFYHFKSKDDMGITMIRELMRDSMKEQMSAPLQTAENPLELIVEMMRSLLLEHPFMQARFGCPTYNLVQEMAPLNADFNKELGAILEDARNYISEAVERAKTLGLASDEVNSGSVADFVMAGYGGIRILGKVEGNKRIYQDWLKQLENYLDSLR